MADTVITVEKIASDDISLKVSGTARVAFTRTTSTGGTQTVYKVDGGDIQFRSIEKTLNDLVDGGGDVDLDLDHLHLTDKDATPVGDAEIFCRNKEIHFKNANDTDYVDIQAAGGFKIPFNFKRSGLQINTSSEDMEILGMENIEYVMPYAGSIIAISAAINTPVTGGYLQVSPRKNTEAINLPITINIPAQYGYTAQNKDVFPFAAGDRIGALITTSGDFAPINSDIVVTVIVEF